MVFGFFKKTAYADLVLKNGRVITQNADMPEADAVACKDGKIIAVGDFDGIEDLISGDTEVIDLGGRYLTPGFISMWEEPALNAFKGKYLDLKGCADKDELISLVKDWAASHKEQDMVFGYGYNERIFSEELQNDREAMSGFIDSACSEKPAVLLCENNISCVFNSQAMEIITQTAEEEMVAYITTPYILNLFVPFDFDEIERTVSSQLRESVKKGVTSVLSLGAPDYFESLYQDALISLYNEDKLCQRAFSSYLLNRPLLPKGLVHRLMQMKTNCNEMNDFFSAKLLLADLDQENCPMDFSSQSLSAILEEVSDKGFDIYIKARSSSDLEKAYMAAEHVRGKGYKNMIAIESPARLSDETKRELMWRDSVYDISEDFKRNAWQNAAFIIGCADRAGSIEPGKPADMAVFETDPYESITAPKTEEGRPGPAAKGPAVERREVCEPLLKGFSAERSQNCVSAGIPTIDAVITIFNGKIIYTAGG